MYNANTCHQHYHKSGVFVFIRRTVDAETLICEDGISGQDFFCSKLF